MTSLTSHPGPHATPAPAAAYGLQRPTAIDAARAVQRVWGLEGALVWDRVSTDAIRLRGTASIDSVLEAMDASSDGVLRLCAESLRIRLRSYDRLAAVHGLMAG